MARPLEHAREVMVNNIRHPKSVRFHSVGVIITRSLSPDVLFLIFARPALPLGSTFNIPKGYFGSGPSFVAL